MRETTPRSATRELEASRSRGLTGTMDAGGSDRPAGGSTDDVQDPALADPGSTTQPAEGGRDEADDGGPDDNGSQEPTTDKTRG